MSDYEENLSCDPANPRRSQVFGPVNEKLATEDHTGVEVQAPATVNATGSTRKNFVQQTFHPSLFNTRPRSSSLGNIFPATATKSVNKPTTPPSKTVSENNI